MRERWSDAEIERAFLTLDSVSNDLQFVHWVTHSQFSEIMDAVHHDFMYGDMRRYLGPEFNNGSPGHYAPNPEMMEFTLALTNGRLGEFRLVDVLPSGASAADVLARGRERERAHARALHEAAAAKVFRSRTEAEIEAVYTSLCDHYGQYHLEFWIKY